MSGSPTKIKTGAEPIMDRMKSNRTAYRLAPLMLALTLALVAPPCLRADEADDTPETEATPIAEIKRDDAVDFQKEILPLLKRSCLACHNASDAESDLVLETPQTILKGGADGEVIKPGNSSESLLLEFASGSGESIMPPEDNDVGAERLTSEELGLLKLWIDQGAKGTVSVAMRAVWQPLPPGVNPIYAVALSFDGQYVACGRANQIFVYHVPSGQLVSRLTDPALVEAETDTTLGTAHRDLVQSLAFSPDGNTLASGGYRVVKLWNRPRNLTRFNVAAGDVPLSALAASPDGKLLVTGGEDGKIRLLDAASGQQIDVLEGHSATVRGAAFSPDSARLVSAADDRTVCLWDIGERRLTDQDETAAAVKGVTFNADGTQIIAAGADGVIRVWSELSAEPREVTGHSSAVTSVAPFASDANRFVSGGEDGSVRVWELSSGKELMKLDHGGPVTSVAVRPDAARIASAGANNMARLWNAEDGKQLAELKGDIEATRRVGMLTLSAERDKSRFDQSQSAFTATEKDKNDKATAAKTATENLAKARTATEKAAAESKAAVEAQPAADKLVADTATQLKAATEAQPVAEKLATQQAGTAEATTKATAQAKVAADAQAQAAAAAAEALAALKAAAEKNPEDKELAAAAEAAQAFATETAANAKTATATLAASQQLSEKKTKAAAASAEAKAAADKALGDTQAAATKATEQKTAADKAAEEKTKAAQQAAANVTASERTKTQADADSTRAAERLIQTTTTRDAEKAAQEAGTARLSEAQQHAASLEKAFLSVTFSADGAMLAVGGDTATLYTFDANDGALLESYSGHEAPIVAVAFTPAGELVSASSDKTVKAWQLYPQWTLSGHLGPPADKPLEIESSPLIDRVIALDFSPDGSLLATGGGEPSRSGELKIWNVADRTLVRDFDEPHSDTVFALRFSPRGTYLAAASADKFAKVFNAESGELVRAFEGHTHHVLGVAWSGDAKRLASAGADQVIKIWNFETGEQRRTIGGFGKQVTAVAFLGNSINTLTACGDAAVRAHNTDNGKAAGNYSGASDFLYSLAATPDGGLLAAGGQDSVLRVWKAGESKPLKTFAPPEEDSQQASR